MSNSNRVRKRTKLIGFILLGVVILLAIVFSLGTRREEGVQTHENPDRASHPIYSKYRFDRSDRVINFGVQPLYLPTGLISEVMKRDRFLQRALKDLGMEIRYYPFLKGDDVNFFLKRHDLQMGIGGDMPAITAAADMKIVIPVKVQQGFTSIVAKHPMLTGALQGKRIAYPFGSISHFAVLDVLGSEGFTESDAVLVPMDPPELGQALDAGVIDAFAVWQPISAMAIKEHPEFVVIYQQMASGYLYMVKDLFQKNPEAVRQIVASVIRAFRWIKKRRENLLFASKWSRQAGEELTGQEIPLSDKEIADLAQQDILELTSLPIISHRDLREDGPLYREFEFLKTLKKIPASTKWARIRDSFDLQIITWVMANRGNYHLNTFDYGLDNPKSKEGEK